MVKADLYFLFGLLCLVCLRGVASQNPIFACDVEGNPTLASFDFCNRTLDVGSRVKDLVGRLTLQEKIGFLVNKAGAVPRLGIPSYEWWSEALHGVSYVGPGTHFSSLVPGATSFPQVILTAASFNTTLFTTIGKVVSTEARAMHNVGLAGLTFWSPNVNIFRDPRWGRGQETPGEDPLLSSKYGASYVSGLQEADELDKLKVAACCKHYTAYDIENWKGIQRFTFNAIVSKQDIEDTYNPPFKSCVVDGNVASVMCSFNQLRVLYNAQHYTKTPEEAAAISIKSGLDLDCGTFLSQHSLAAIQAGNLSEADVDRAISNNFATQMRLGFFDGNPRQLAFGKLGPSDVCTKANQDLALEAARQGIVLLKNSNGSLPLDSSSIDTLALIGPNINVTKTMIGNYEGTPCKYTTPLQGLTATSSNSKILAVPGCTDVACSANGFQLDAAKQAAAKADVTVLIVGADQSVEREGVDRTDLNLPGQQNVLVQEVTKAAKGLVVLVIMSGGPFDVSFAKDDDRVSAILWVGYPGRPAGCDRRYFVWQVEATRDMVPPIVRRQGADDRHANEARPIHRLPRRTYRFYTGDVVYAFGDGLSYTDFNHELIQAPQVVSVFSRRRARLDQGCTSLDVAESWCRKLLFDVHLKVENIGSRAGGHTVFMYYTPPNVHNAPRKHLLGFEKLHLQPKATGKVVFGVDVCKDMSLADEAGNRKLALGSHVLHVGNLKHSLVIGV
ncbi:hypothetical protein HPP92_027718 [Vanilla planifolia]|uniref:Fibronectin type III-like domain-containing protein n=1 Tax=Vanilla planifolia TaxID=51239 RepID=A0A835U757_VANPL|nr:hypothetical protein HPP92_027718 [Vanilla planifolia]